MTGRQHSAETIKLQKANSPRYWQGKKRSEASVLKMQESAKGHTPWNKGKTTSDEVKKKQRVAAIQRLQRSYGKQVIPNYNPNACKAIDAHGELHGYKFQHAENGGEFYVAELGYWVDGYDRERNTVVEYYERDHSYSYRSQRDARRQKEITEHLDCEFIILQEVIGGIECRS
jgi:hypothetical protein